MLSRQDPERGVAPSTEPIVSSSLNPPVRGFIHTPSSPLGLGLVLTHGAGGDCRTPMLITLAEAGASLGLTVLRCDLPYRQMRPSGPPRPGGSARDRAGLANAVAVLAGRAGNVVCMGGQSYGGRQATMLAAEQPGLAHALLILSYPLHPPRRSGELRTAHLPQLRTPAMFVQGSRDPFGSVTEMEEALRLISAPTALMTIDGVGHDLMARGGRSGDRVGEIARRFVEFATSDYS
jgi:predicted alpha/beta-hydrolase family hydrolase